MGTDISEYKKSALALEAGMPELVEIHVIQEFSDILIYKGLKRMVSIIDKGDNGDVIKSVNSLANVGRYLEQRKLNTHVIESGITYDDPDLILDVEQEEQENEL